MIPEVLIDQAPDKEDDFSYDYEIFLRGYEAVKKARHNRFDPELVARARKNDRDAAEQMLIKAGIIDSLKEK